MLCGRIVIDMKTYSLLDVYKLNRKILGVMMPIAATVFLLLAIIILIAMPTIWWGSLISVSYTHLQSRYSNDATSFEFVEKQMDDWCKERRLDKYKIWDLRVAGF